MPDHRTHLSDPPPAWTQRPDRPAGVFVSYAGPRRDRARVGRRSLFSIYIVLLLVTAGFGVLAAYQWERAKDANEQADRMSSQTEALTQRVKELESLGAGLAELVAAAYEGDPKGLVARLDEMEERRPDGAVTEIFTRLWVAAKEQETQGRTGFETASGGEPSRGPSAAPAPEMDIAKAELAPQDQSEIDRIDQAKSARADAEPARTDGASIVNPPLDNASANRADKSRPEIVIAAREETWLQISDGDGRVIYTRLMKAGEHYSAPPSAAILVTGNPSGLSVEVGGVAAPPFNPKGPTRREIALDPQRLLDGAAERR